MNKSNLTWSVEFCDDPYASESGVFNHVFDVVLGINVTRTVGSVSAEAGVAGALVGETVVVHYVPMKDVELVHSHRVQQPVYGVQRHEVSRRVQEKTSVREPREVRYRCTVHK